MTKHRQGSYVIISTTRPIAPCTLLRSKSKAVKAIHPVGLWRQICIAAGTQVSHLPQSDEQKEETHERDSAMEGTTVDSEPNFVKAVVEPGAAGEPSPSCFRVSSLRLSECILTLLRLRMKPDEEAPTKRGRSNGRQAPTMPMDDSTIGQYTMGVFISAVRC